MIAVLSTMLEDCSFDMLFIVKLYACDVCRLSVNSIYYSTGVVFMACTMPFSTFFQNTTQSCVKLQLALVKGMCSFYLSLLSLSRWHCWLVCRDTHYLTEWPSGLSP